MQRAGSAALTNVGSSLTNVTILAANPTRLGFIIFNDSTAVLYFKFGATASVTSYTEQIAAGGKFEMIGDVVYGGQIDGLWAAANGNARITELI